MYAHKGTQTLETPRLILRKAVKTDALPMFHNWASDPEVTKYLTWQTYLHVNEAHKILDIWIKEYEKPEFYQWMIELKDLNQPIGSISVVHCNDQIAEMEVGYCIGRPWWHKGIMTEALSAVIDFLFTKVGVDRITAKHDTNNPRSGGVMKKCGMIYEGTTRSSDKNNQGICDTANYSIAYSDWNQGKTQ